MVTEPNQRTLRNTFGRFATGVTVVSTSTEYGPHAMTLNAFIPLSLTPPLIAVSIADKAKISPLIAESGHYVVNVLSNDQRTTSSHFAGIPVGDPEVQFATVGGMPVLEGAMAWIGARVVDTHQTGDHVLYIGEVEHLETTDNDPLVFFCGKYRALSGKYEPHQYVDAWSMFDVVP